MVYYPVLTAVIGLGVFARGITHWGLYYLTGLSLLLLAVLMPQAPDRYWPTIHAIPLLGWWIWNGIRLRRFDREARIGRPATSTN
jgi:hypothetical protein